MELTLSQINFGAKVDSAAAKKGLKKTITAAAAGGMLITSKLLSDPGNEDPLMNEMIAMGNNAVIKTPARTKRDISDEQAWKAKKIRNVIVRRIHKNEQITIEEIAKRTGLPLNQIVTIIYRNNFPEVREMFDKVKDKTRLEKPVTQENIDFAQNITGKASRFFVTSPEITEAEDDYIQALAVNIKKAQILSHWNDEVMQVFGECFMEAPAFADMLISVKNKKNIIRSISSPDNMQLIFDTHKINPELTEELALETDKDGTFKYTLFTINKIVTVAEKYPDLVDLAKKDTDTIYWLASMTDKNDNQYLTADEIKQIYEYMAKYPELTKRLLNERIVTVKVNEKESDIENSDNVQKCVSADEVNEEASETRKRDVVKIHKYSGDQILYILKKYETEPKLVSALLNCERFQFGTKLSGKLIVNVLKTKEAATKENKRWSVEFFVDGKALEFSNKKELKEKNIKFSKAPYYDFGITGFEESGMY